MGESGLSPRINFLCPMVSAGDLSVVGSGALLGRGSFLLCRNCTAVQPAGKGRGPHTRSHSPKNAINNSNEISKGRDAVAKGNTVIIP